MGRGNVAEFVTPASTFAAGRALREGDDQWVELERLLPTDEGTVPFLWVWGGDHDAFEARIESESGIETDEPIAETASGALYRVRWQNAMSEKTRGLFEHEFTLLSGRRRQSGGGSRFGSRTPGPPRRSSPT